MSKSKVYFTKTITPEKVVEMYKKLNINLTGKIALKVHSGEKGNQNFMRPEFWKAIYDYTGGTFVECNTAYPGARNSTDKHKALLKEHGWTKYRFDLMDAEGPDLNVKIPNGLCIKENWLGKTIKNYDSCIVLCHFKGHLCGGYGCAMKQLSIGFGSTAGKSWQHSGGKTIDQNETWKNMASNEKFTESMADAASSVIELFKGKIAYIAVMKNISTSCDCDGQAPKPCMEDIGILSSLDPIALDQACLDLVYRSNNPGRRQLTDRIESRFGSNVLASGVKLGLGNREYELINVDIK